MLPILLLERHGHIILMGIFLLVSRNAVAFVHACAISQAGGGLEFGAASSTRWQSLQQLSLKDWSLYG